jgi:flagellar hook-associated protein 2
MGVSLNPATILSGQGLNVSSVVSQIISSQSGELSVWQGQQTTLATQEGLLEGEENNLVNLQTAVQALADPAGALFAQAATSSDTSILSATAQPSAITAVHQIVVNTLATAGTLYTDPIAAGADTSFLSSGQTAGDVQLEVGGAAGTTYDIPITQGSNDTLSTLASYINTQSSANNWGVTASVVSDTSGSRLALFSQNTGTAGALSIANNSNTTLSFDTPVGGTDAALTIDGVPFSSTTNTLTGAIQGVTLNLAGASAGTTVQLSVGADTNQITNAVNNFVSAYNAVVSTINTQYVVDPTGATPAPPLESDLSLRSLQTSILNDVADAIGDNSGYVNLASLGINSNNDGTLTVGSNASGETFADILETDPTAVQNFFQNTSGTGFANNFNSDLANLTDATTGPLNVDLAQDQAEGTDLTTTIANFQTQLTSQTQALTSEYDAVNASLQSYPLLLQEITETLGSLGTSSTGTSTGVTSPTLTAGL